MLRDYPKCRSCLKILKSLCSAGIQSIGVELAGGVLSRPVSPKLAHEAVLAKPPYFDDTSCIRTVQNEEMNFFVPLRLRARNGFIGSAQGMSKMRLTGVQNVCSPLCGS